MPLTIPNGQAEVLKDIVGLTSERWAQLLASLGEAPPTLDMEELAERVGHVVAPPVLGVLAGLSLAYERADIPLDEFLGEFADAVRGAGLTPAIGWLEFREKVKSALSTDTLGIAAKAVDILTEHPRVYQTARVVTDVRAVFRPVLDDQPPNAAVLVHTLKIRSHVASSGGSDFFVALDTHDVQGLIKVLQRALKKERGLRTMMEKSGISCLSLQPKGETQE